jgi:hypothetical protein
MNFALWAEECCMCRETVLLIDLNAPQFCAEISTGFILLLYRGIHFCIVSKCVRRFKVLVVVKIEIVFCWVMTHIAALVVTVGSEEYPSSIFRVV